MERPHPNTPAGSTDASRRFFTQWVNTRRQCEFGEVFPRFQFVPARISIIVFAGLPVLARPFESVGVVPALEERLRFLERRQRGYSVGQFVLSLMLFAIAGGEGLTDVHLLQSDRSFNGLPGRPRLPAVTILGQFLNRAPGAHLRH
jgi:hypothetical protein